MSLNQRLTTTVGGNWEPLKVFGESSVMFLRALGERRRWRVGGMPSGRAGGQVNRAAAVRIGEQCVGGR